MDQDDLKLARIEQLLEENLEIAEENNKLLRDMRRTNRIGFWFRILIWAAVIILPFLLLKPILETFIPATGGGEAGFGIFGFPSQEDIENALDAYQGGE